MKIRKEKSSGPYIMRDVRPSGRRQEQERANSREDKREGCVWNKPLRALRGKSEHIKAPCFIQFRQKLSANQKAGDNEENINSQKTTGNQPVIDGGREKQ